MRGRCRRLQSMDAVTFARKVGKEEIGMIEKRFVKTRLFWYRKPQTQVAPNRKRVDSKYACRRSRRERRDVSW